MLSATVAVAQLSRFPGAGGEPVQFKAHYHGAELCFSVPPDQERAWLAQVGQGMNVSVVLEIDSIDLDVAETEPPLEPEHAPSTVLPPPDLDIQIEDS